MAQNLDRETFQVFFIHRCRLCSSISCSAL